jgi:predicted nucleic acid-binding protein
MSNKIDIHTYKPKVGDAFFFDNNIWMYLFCPVNNYNKKLVNTYNTFFLEIIKNKCSIYTSSLVLSEFFNSYCRVDFKAKQKTDPTLKDYKKDFRNTPHFNILSESICNIIKDKILKYSIRLDDDFATLDIDDILIADKNFDFNDKYIAKLCENKKIKILTNDKDFLNLSNNVDIITI